MEQPDEQWLRGHSYQLAKCQLCKGMTYFNPEDVASAPAASRVCSDCFEDHLRSPVDRESVYHESRYASPEASSGVPDVDAALRGLPDAFAGLFGDYEQRRGYKCWKVPGRRLNWLQWNDGGVALPIRFEDESGRLKTWKLFARFPSDPGEPWSRPTPHHQDHKWMPGGDDVWGCAYEDLSGHLSQIDALKSALTESLREAKEYTGG